MAKEKDLRTVQYMAGHKYVSSTERYQTTNLEDLKDAWLSVFIMGITVGIQLTVLVAIKLVYLSKVRQLKYLLVNFILLIDFCWLACYQIRSYKKIK